jgi:hypothetical protein
MVIHIKLKHTVVVLNFNKYPRWKFFISNIVQVGLILLHGYVPKKTPHISNTTFPIVTVYFPGVKEMTSSYIVYDYTTSWQTDL